MRQRQKKTKKKANWSRNMPTVTQHIDRKTGLGIIQRGFLRDVIPLYKGLAERINLVMARYAVGDVIPVTSESALLRDVNATLTAARFFTDSDGRTVYASDGVTALADYPRLLNKWYAIAVASAIMPHTKYMQRKLPPDIFAWLGKRDNPRLIRELENPYRRLPGESLQVFRNRMIPLRIFQSNPLADIDPQRRWVPMHNWNTPDGYRLSDRIWNADNELRRRIDALLRDGLRNGDGSLVLSRRLERFLIPGRAALRTRRPYGTDASFDGMRLARTELARAFNYAAYIAGYSNPYVSGIDWALSPSHPKVDICDSLATIDMGGGRIKEPYPMGSANVPPAHPHCLCTSRSVVTESPADVTNRLRAVYEDGSLNPATNPANPYGLLEQLIGPVLLAAFIQYIRVLFGA